jgi:hypothetical protein
MKTKTPSVPVVLPQHLKEQEILDFLNSDRSGKVETILRNAGVLKSNGYSFHLMSCTIVPFRWDINPIY